GRGRGALQGGDRPMTEPAPNERTSTPAGGAPTPTTDPARIRAVPYFAYLGLELGPDDTVVMPIDDRHASDRPAVHGGVLTAFVEAVALLHLDAGGEPARTAELSVTFLRRADLVPTIGRARVVRRGRRFTQV